MAESTFRRRLRVRLLLATVATVATLGLGSVAHAGDLPSTADAPGAHERAMTEARRHFTAGVNLLDDPDGAKYEEAYGAFRKAYELSQSPKVLGNMAFCAMHLERDGEAIDAYTKYLSDTLDVPERERAQIQKDLATLTSTVGRLRLTVNKTGSQVTVVDTRVQTRGPSVENTYAISGGELTIRLRPGRHALKVKVDGEESLPIEVTMEPGGQLTQEARFAAPKAAPEPALTLVRESPSMAGPVLLGVTGILALGAGAVTGVMARSKTDAIQTKCPDDVCPSDYDLAAARGSAKTFGTVADATLIGGGALVGGALLWYALLPGKGSSSTNAAKAPPVRTSAMCTALGCNVQVQGGF